MAMRLLTKSEIDTAKAAEQKRNIDEGLKLARRVDNLREVAAEEEASLAKFRKEQTAKIHAELEKLYETKGTLIGEVSQLKRERKELMKPLDAELAKIYKENAQLEKKRDELTSKEIAISQREKGTKKALTLSADLLTKAALKDGRAADLLLDADTKAQEAIETLKNAREVEAKALDLKKEVEQELAERDMTMAAKERGLEMRDAALAESEAELAKGWVLLEDRRNMVEQRIKKQK